MGATVGVLMNGPESVMLDLLAFIHRSVDSCIWRADGQGEAGITR